MALSRDADASLLRLFHVLLALFIIALLMWGTASQFLARRQDALAASWQQRGADFAERVELLHGEWLSQGHPRQIFHVMADESGLFVVNGAGWPIDWQPTSRGIAEALPSRCSRLWRGLLGKAGQFASHAVEFELDPYGACLFRLGELSYRYDDLHGNVISSSDRMEK